jgi:hypothetical protein
MFNLAFKLGVLAAKLGWEVTYQRHYCPVVHEGRNQMLRAGQTPSADVKVLAGMDYDRILWLETDMVFKPEDVLQLLEDDADVVSAVYPMSPELSDIAVAGNLPAQRLVIPNLVRHASDLIEVDFCGLGMVAVRRGVFESLPYPWFHTLYSGSEYIGDDFGWCSDVKAKGFKIYVDRRVRAGHQKTVIV